jgi:metallo-beta-lactamase class B
MHIFKKTASIAALTTGILLICFLVNAQKKIVRPYEQDAWKKNYEPFRVAGNLYYVGTYDLSSYLITTTDGHILINTGLAESVPMIKSHVEALGFKFSDIKILLATHAHYDHVAGMAEIKKITGASMLINERDATVLADGGNSDFIFGGKGATFEPVKADSFLHDNDTVMLGGVQIIVLSHPGHTKGASSFLFDVKDEKQTYRVLIANMPTILDETKLSGMPGYPDVGNDYGRTLERMKNIKFDLWLASHASQFELHKKRKPGDPYNPKAFVDQNGYDATINTLYQVYLKKLSAK